MKTVYLICSFVLYSVLGAQTTIDFENFDTSPNGFLNGSDGTEAFVADNLAFPVSYNATYDSWSGWAISSVVDTTTAGFTNQFGAITGGGFEGSANHAVSFVAGTSVLNVTDASATVRTEVSGFYVTNGTYPYLSMLNGDGFAKRFGGETGDDPDFLLLTIKGSLNGVVSADSVNFYLADYRFDDNNLDYIIDEWTFVNTSSLGEVDQLVFSMSGTDNDPMFGLNTPAYFHMDNLEVNTVIVSTENPELASKISVYPNPVRDHIQWSYDGLATLRHVELIDQNGRVLAKIAGNSGDDIDLDYINSTGRFALRFVTDTGVVVKSFVKL